MNDEQAPKIPHQHPPHNELGCGKTAGKSLVRDVNDRETRLSLRVPNWRLQGRVFWPRPRGCACCRCSTLAAFRRVRTGLTLTLDSQGEKRVGRASIGIAAMGVPSRHAVAAINNNTRSVCIPTRITRSFLGRVYQGTSNPYVQPHRPA